MKIKKSEFKNNNLFFMCLSWSFKVALLFPINEFPKNNILQTTYIIILLIYIYYTCFLLGNLLSLKEKTHNIGFHTFKLPASSNKSLMTDPCLILFMTYLYMITCTRL